MLRHIVLSASYLACVVDPADSQIWTGNSLVSQAEVRDAAQSGKTIPFSSISKKLSQNLSGKLVDASLYSDQDGGYQYDVVWINGEGRRLKIRVDALTGEILETRGGS